jgi:hypothetical protein
MKPLVVIVFVFCFSGLLSAQAEKAGSSAKSGAGTAKTTSHKEAKITTPDQLMWSPLMPGVEMAPVIGNPKAAGQFVMRLRATDDAKIPPHWHPTDEYVTVLAGDFSAGMGRAWDDAQVKTAPVHTVAMMPARMPHYAQFKKGTEIQINGAGPFVINYVNPVDDPNKKK